MHHHIFDDACFSLLSVFLLSENYPVFFVLLSFYLLVEIWPFAFRLRRGEYEQDFPGGTVDKNPPANAGDTGQSLVQEDSACCRATKPVRHNYWHACSGACEPLLMSRWATTTEGRMPEACAPQQEKPLQHNEEQPPLCNYGKPACSNKDPM